MLRRRVIIARVWMVSGHTMEHSWNSWLFWVGVAAWLEVMRATLSLKMNLFCGWFERDFSKSTRCRIVHCAKQSKCVLKPVWINPILRDLIQRQSFKNKQKTNASSHSSKFCANFWPTRASKKGINFITRLWAPRIETMAAGWRRRRHKMTAAKVRAQSFGERCN